MDYKLSCAETLRYYLDLSKTELLHNKEVMSGVHVVYCNMKKTRTVEPEPVLKNCLMAININVSLKTCALW